jgi:hypothetical protein
MVRALQPCQRTARETRARETRARTRALGSAERRGDSLAFCMWRGTPRVRETENGGTLRARDSRPTLTAFRRVLCVSLAWGAPPSFKRSPGSTPSVRACVRRWIAGDVLPHLREGGGDVPHIRRAVHRQSAIAPTMPCPPSSWRHLGGAPAEGRASQSDGRVALSTLFRCCCAIRPWSTGVRVPLEYP